MPSSEDLGNPASVTVTDHGDGAPPSELVQQRGAGVRMRVERAPGTVRRKRRTLSKTGQVRRHCYSAPAEKRSETLEIVRGSRIAVQEEETRLGRRSTEAERAE